MPPAHGSLTHCQAGRVSLRSLGSQKQRTLTLAAANLMALGSKTSRPSRRAWTISTSCCWVYGWNTMRRPPSRLQRDDPSQSLRQTLGSPACNALKLAHVRHSAARCGRHSWRGFQSAPRNAWQKALWQVHRVGDANNSQSRALPSRPLHQVVQHLRTASTIVNEGVTIGSEPALNTAYVYRYYGYLHQAARGQEARSGNNRSWLSCRQRGEGIAATRAGSC